MEDHNKKKTHNNFLKHFKMSVQQPGSMKKKHLLEN